jgi:hypothetical protein
MLKMELDLQSLFWPLCTAVRYSFAKTQQPPPPSPLSWAPIRERYWSAKTDDI